MSDKPFRRIPPERLGPRRGAGGFYRAATAAPGSKGAGIPLDNPNDALVAAVRMAYRVAEAQVDRSSRLARRLQEAGDRVTGGDSELKAMDATERLVMKTLMSALEWWEGSVAQGRCPVKRLAAAEYRMMGSILGFEAPEDRAPARAAAPPKEARGETKRAARRLRIVHDGAQRAVLVRDWQLEAAGPVQADVRFFHPDDEEPITGRFVRERNTATLHINIQQGRVAPGAWKAAICSSEGEQLGYIEVVL